MHLYYKGSALLCATETCLLLYACMYGITQIYVDTSVHQTLVCSSIFVEWLIENSCVTRYALHMDHTLCVKHKPYFMQYMWAMLCVLHDSMKHASQTLCAAHELTAILGQIRIKAYNEMSQKQNMIKCIDTENSILLSIYIPLFQSWHT